MRFKKSSGTIFRITPLGVMVADQAQEARSQSSRPDQFSQYFLPFARREGKIL